MLQRLYRKLIGVRAVVTKDDAIRIVKQYLTEHGKSDWIVEPIVAVEDTFYIEVWVPQGRDTPMVKVSVRTGRVIGVYTMTTVEEFPDA